MSPCRQLKRNRKCIVNRVIWTDLLLHSTNMVKIVGLDFLHRDVLVICSIFTPHQHYLFFFTEKPHFSSLKLWCLMSGRPLLCYSLWQFYSFSFFKSINFLCPAVMDIDFLCRVRYASHTQISQTHRRVVYMEEGVRGGGEQLVSLWQEVKQHWECTAAVEALVSMFFGTVVLWAQCTWMNTS